MIRNAVLGDLPGLEGLYAGARAFMKRTGNPNQWGNTNPPMEVLERDIALGQLYVVEEDLKIRGAFALIFGADPTYGYIEGAWTQNGPYATIHRLAGDGSGGVFVAAMEFAMERTAFLRIDTHADNALMHHLLQKHGFTRCGVIYLANGAPRIAYERGK